MAQSQSHNFLKTPQRVYFDDIKTWNLIKSWNLTKSWNPIKSWNLFKSWNLIKSCNLVIKYYLELVIASIDQFDIVHKYYVEEIYYNRFSFSAGCLPDPSGFDLHSSVYPNILTVGHRHRQDSCVKQAANLYPNVNFMFVMK